MFSPDINDPILTELFNLRDEKYQAFQAKLIPNISSDSIIGVRTPELRRIAKRIYSEGSDEFLSQLPHKYFEENQLHAFILSHIKELDKCISETERFLPFIDNWATCDQAVFPVFSKNKDKLLPFIEKWISSHLTYTVRFAVKLLMQYYLDDAFDMKYPEMVSKIKSDEYYVNMMCAWYFATALAKQYDAVIPYLESKALSPAVHKMTVKKAVESYRISDETKAYLKTL